MNRFFNIGVLCLLACAASAPAFGQTYYDWDGTTGDYNTAANWNPDYPLTPTTDDSMRVNNGGTCQITSDVVLNSPAFLYAAVLAPGGVANTGTVEQSAGALTITGGLRVGFQGGIGAYNMTGGVLNATGTGTATGLAVGYDDDPAAVGTYGNGTLYLSGTAQANFANESRIGYAGGTGTVDLSGSAIMSTGGLTYFGTGTGSNGTLKMYNNSSLSVTGTGYVGRSGAIGNATLYNSSDWSVTGTLYVGVNALGTGTLKMYGDDLATDSTLSTANLSIGYALRGTGTVEMYDSTRATVVNLTVANSTTGAPTAGYYATGTLNLHDNASLTSSDYSVVGLWSNSRGYLNLYDDSSFTVETGGTSPYFVVGDSNYSGTTNPRDGGRGYVTINDNATVTVKTTSSSGAIIGNLNAGHGVVTVGNGNGTATLNTAGLITLGYIGGEGTLNINSGGVVVAPRIRVSYSGGTGALNFNGGTFKATMNRNDFIYNGGGAAGNVYIQAGGAIIDSNGYNVVIKTPLLDGGGGGGLTKNSEGTLVLASDANTYTGATQINAGTLAAYGNLGPITTAAGAKLMAARWDTTNTIFDITSTGGVSLNTTALTVADGSYLDFVVTTPGLFGGGISSMTTGSLAAAGDSATVVIDLFGNTPSAGYYNLINYTTKTGTLSFLPVYDSYDTLAMQVIDTGYSIAANFGGLDNYWTSSGLDNNFSSVGNWTSYVPNGTDKRAYFQGSGETVNLDADATVSSLIFNGGGFHLSPTGASTLTLDSTIAANTQITNVAGSNTVSAPIVMNKDTRITVSQDGDTLTLGGSISGAHGILKRGMGKLTLLNAGNSFSGPLVVESGTLEAGSAGALGVGTGAAGDLVIGGSLKFGDVVHGGLFRYTGASGTTNRGLTIAGAVTAEVNTPDATLTMAGAVATKSGSLIKKGAGNLELKSPSATNALGSSLTIHEGGLTLSSSAGTTQYDVTGAINMATPEVEGGSGATAGLTLNGDAVLKAMGHAAFAQYGGAASLTMNDNALFIGTSGRVGGQYADPITSERNHVDIVMNDASKIQFSNFFNFGEQYSDASLAMHDSASITASSVDIGWGAYANSTATLNGTSSLVTAGEVNIAVNGDYATGSVTLNENAHLGAGHINIGSAGVGIAAELIMNGSSTATVTGAVDVGNYQDANGTLRMTGDSVLTAASWISVGNVFRGGGAGEAFLSDNARMETTANELEVAWGGTGILHVGDGTPTDNAVVASYLPVILGWGERINLGDDILPIWQKVDTNARIDLNGGGTLAAPGITNGNSGAGFEVVSSILNFNGGTLKATGASADFITNPGAAATFLVNVQAGGARIDTNGHAVAINVPLTQDPLSTGGGLTKLGDGRLTLGGANSYTGDTTVAAGRLDVAGSIASDVTVDAAGTLMGSGVVTGNVDLNGTLAVEYNGDTETMDLLTIAGQLDLTGGTIGFENLGTDPLALGTYVFAAYTSLLGNPTATTGLLPGWSIDYAYDYAGGENNALALIVGTPVQIPGDADGNLIVDAADAEFMAANWGLTSGATWAMGDFNRDGAVNAMDASILAANWGDHRAEGLQNVPEPGVFALLLGLSLVLLRRRNR